MINLKKTAYFARAIFCVTICFASVFNFARLNAQTKRSSTFKQNAPAVSAITATLTDSFADQNGDKKAQPGEEVTYTATITNNDAVNPLTNVNFTAPVDANATLVPDSVQVRRNLSPYTIRCNFSVIEGTGDCSKPSLPYGETNAENFTILGGQDARVKVEAGSVNYNMADEVFSFDLTVKNLLSQSLGSLDDATLEPTGVSLFVENAAVTAGTGNISFIGEDGTEFFTVPNQPFYKFNEIIREQQVSSRRTIPLNVPNTVKSFTVEFLVSTKVTPKLVINEVLVNPGGTISDASGEWFEVYNNGLFPVNMQNFRVGDSAASGDRPTHSIAQSLIIQPNDFLVFGNTTNTTNNGGVPVDYAYGASMALANSLDAVRILSPYHVDPNPGAGIPGNVIELDRATYRSAAVSAQNGISRELKDPSLDNSRMDFYDDNTPAPSAENWGDASVTAVYGPGGRGTPGAANSVTINPPVPSGETSACAASADNLAPADTVSAVIGNMQPGETVTVIYRVKISDTLPSGTSQINAQATVTDDLCNSVLTDDPETSTENDATITPIEQAASQGYSISGIVSYANTPADETMKYVPQVVVNVAAAASGFAVTPSPLMTTDSAGSYQIDNLTAGGEYTVTPSRTGDINGITPFDATLILRCVAAGESCALTKNQRIAADADNNSSITTFDAVLILRFVAAGAQIPESGEVGNWKFSPSTRHYASLTGSLSGEDYEAFLIGEVSGNWTPSLTGSLAEMIYGKQAGKEAPSVLALGSSVSISSPAMQQAKGADFQLSISDPSLAESGNEVVIPVHLTNKTGNQIFAYNFAVLYDPSVLQLQPGAVDAANTLSSNGFTVVSDTSRKGRIGIAASASQTSVKTSGTLVFLRFRNVGSLNKVAKNRSLLSLREASVYILDGRDQF